jgi:hypothetical protein
MPSWYRRIRGVLSGWLDAYFRARYRLAARLAGRGGRAADLARRGLLVIQIDALSYDDLVYAMNRRHMRFLRKLCRRKGFRLHRWYCGAPSNTPSVQAAILYGHNDDIPGFRWYEKATGQHFNFKNPFAAQEVERRLKQHGPGLLAEGSSYANLFTGDAPTAILTLSSVADLSVGRTLRGFQIPLLMALNVVAVTRAAVLTVRELLAELFEWARLLLTRRIQRGEYLFPLLRIIVGVWFREIITQGALHEILAGRPAIYLTFASYDEAAHQRGQRSASAMRSLRGIDGRIRRLVKVARRGIVRQYDVVILSDHGQTPSMPFHYLYTETIHECVARLLEGGVQAGTTGKISDAQLTYAAVLIHRLQAYERDFARTGRLLVRWALRFVRRRSVPTPSDAPGPADGAVVATSGPLCNVYLPGHKKLSDDEITHLRPHFIDGLVQHDGIGIVVTTADDTVILRSRRGELRVGLGGNVSTGQPFGELGMTGREQELAERELVKLARMHNSGDVILLGAAKKRYIVNFEEQMAAHGGLGDGQTSPFIICPADMPVPDDLIDPRQLNALLGRRGTNADRGPRRAQ